MQRYQINEGVVIKRYELPSGDVIVTLLGQHGKWQAKVKKGKRLGGQLGKLSLFHDVTAQYYRKAEESLAVLTQVELNGALPRLSDPTIYPYAHILAELVDKLTVDVHIGEAMYKYFVSSLRGLNAGEKPEIITIIYVWRLIQTAGLSPRLERCVICGSRDLDLRFDIALGGISCKVCARGLPISSEVLGDLQTLHSLSVREVLTRGVTKPGEHLRLIDRFLAYHVSELNSLSNLGTLSSA